MNNSISENPQDKISACCHGRWMAWIAILAFSLPLQAGILDSEIMTYQGRLLESGAPFNGSLDMTFELWTDESGGSLVTSQSISGVSVSDGLFQVELLFGNQPYETGLWLQVEADGSTLSPRQRVAAAPLALHALNGGNGYWDLSGGVLSYDGAVSIGTGVQSEALTVNGSTVGVTSTGGGNGVLGLSNDGIGVQGFVSGTDNVNYGIYGSTMSATGYGVFASNLHETGTALRAEGYTGVWIDAETTGLVSHAGLMGIVAEGENIGVWGASAESGVYGYASDSNGYGGRFGGVEGSSSYFSHRVGIGAADPAATLEIDGPGIGSNNLALRVSVNDDQKLVVGGLGTSIYHPVFVDGTVTITSFAPGGSTAVCHTGSPGFTGVLAECSSSARYKSDIATLQDASRVIEGLRAVTFRWTESGEEDFGLVAEEVAEIEPRLVTHNSEGRVEGVKYRQLSALLIRAMQEQRREFDRLQHGIEALHHRLEQADEIERRNAELSERLDRLEALLTEQRLVGRQD